MMPIDDLESGESCHGWDEYNERVKAYEERVSSHPGHFATDPSQHFYDQCVACPIVPRALAEMPIRSLPLQVNLIRNQYLGCSETTLNPDTVSRMVQETVNALWCQAGVRWNLVGVVDRSFETFDDFSASKQQQVRDFIHKGLTRGPDGRMQNKQQRAKVFLGTMLSLFEYDKIGCYNVWIFDVVGRQSQGCCIDRKNRTVILGERSDKGYPTFTKRPQACLAKTMAHELGHALGLGHPRGRSFADGTSQILTTTRGGTTRKNLMEGGVDRKGGGGDFLEQWQICLARSSAEQFLKKQEQPKEVQPTCYKLPKPS